MPVIHLYKRARSYHVYATVAGRRLRGTLGTQSRAVSRQIASRMEVALTQGPQSALWTDLAQILPPQTYGRFAGHVGLRPAEAHTWVHLASTFHAHLNDRVQAEKFSAHTQFRYLRVIDRFTVYLNTRGLTILSEITPNLLLAFKSHRQCEILAHPNARGGGAVALESAILHRIFAFGIESGLLQKNPVKIDGTPGANPERGAEPYSAEELRKLRVHAGPDTLLFLLLRWTGLRGSDAANLRWSQVSLFPGEIDRICQKNKRRVIIPLHDELLQALTAVENDDPYCASALPVFGAPYGGASDRHVLLHPESGLPMDRPAIYQRVVALGKRAGVDNAHPHRFRDTLAVDMLLRGSSPYDVAKILGDTIATIERHYTPFVHALRERVRGILANDAAGLENSS